MKRNDGKNVNYGKYVLTACGLLLLAACQSKPPAAAKDEPPQVIEKTAAKDHVQLTVRVTPREPRLADCFSFDILVKAPAGVEIKPPDFGKGVGSFLIRDYQHSQEVRENETEQRFHYKLEATFAGKHLLRSTSIEYKDAGGKFILLETQPLSVFITSELGDAAPTLANLKPDPLALPRPLPVPPWKIWQLSVLGVALVALGILGAWWYVRRKNRVAIAKQKTPEELACEELAALLAEGLPQKGMFKEFYVRLTALVRVYIERTTGIHAPEQTTEEFLYAMRESKDFPPQRAQSLAVFLEAADMVKYAALLPGERQVEEAVARAQEFVGSPSALAPLPATVAAP